MQETIKQNVQVQMKEVKSYEWHIYGDPLWCDYIEVYTPYGEVELGIGARHGFISEYCYQSTVLKKIMVMKAKKQDKLLALIDVTNEEFYKIILSKLLALGYDEQIAAAPARSYALKYYFDPDKIYKKLIRLLRAKAKKLSKKERRLHEARAAVTAKEAVALYTRNFARVIVEEFAIQDCEELLASRTKTAEFREVLTMPDISNEIMKAISKEVETAKIKTNFNNLPDKLKFYDYNGNIKMQLSAEAVGLEQRVDSKNKSKYVNMQEDMAAFEGWAVIIKAFYIKDKDIKLILDVDGYFKSFLDTFEQERSTTKKGTVGRFLYRALRFSEQYSEWFELSWHLNNAVQNFKEKYLNKKSTNNVSQAEQNSKTGLEGQVEDYITKNPAKLFEIIKQEEGLEDISGEMYRQLPVGLYSANKNRKAKKADVVLKGGAGAKLDLWNLAGQNKDILTLFELKSLVKPDKKKAGKVDIISEIFFYANYCRDMFGKHAIFTRKKEGVFFGGYQNLVDANIESINAVMLSDNFHPTLKIEEDGVLKIVKVLNKNNTCSEATSIQYYRVWYQSIFDEQGNLVTIIK